MPAGHGVAGGWVGAGHRQRRLNLIEGDLTITVTEPGGSTRTAGWPWPADSGARTATLQPGERLVTGLLLLSTAASQPLVDQPGRYVVRASYAAGGVEVQSEPVTVLRSPATDQALASALADRDVIQSLLSVSVIGAAGPGWTRSSPVDNPSPGCSAGWPPAPSATTPLRISTNAGSPLPSPPSCPRPLPR